jgi:hypothetical protein
MTMVYAPVNYSLHTEQGVRVYTFQIQINRNLYCSNLTAV